MWHFRLQYLDLVKITSSKSFIYVRKKNVATSIWTIRNTRNQWKSQPESYLTPHGSTISQVGSRTLASAVGVGDFNFEPVSETSMGIQFLVAWIPFPDTSSPRVSWSLCLICQDKMAILGNLLKDGGGWGRSIWSSPLESKTEYLSIPETYRVVE